MKSGDTNTLNLGKKRGREDSRVL